MKQTYMICAKLVPPSIKKKLKVFLGYSNVRIDHETFIGFVTFCSLLIGLAGGFFLGFYYSFWVFFVVLIIISNAAVYLWIAMMIDKKAQLVEEALPDALQLMTSNLRTGMTPERALLLASRPEFGPLKHEIDIVGRKVTLGENVGTALMEMTKHVRSKRLLRTIELINSGLESGGSLAVLLEATANGLREQLIVDKRIKASITMYVIFIFAASALISPILFGLASFLVDVLRASFAQIDIPASAASTLPIGAAKINISTEFLIQFIVAFITCNLFMASMLLGIIGSGKRREGIKLFLPMLALAIPLFFLGRYAIKLLLGGLFEF
jgi:Type II secretion system (T2SS), protein F